MAFWGLGLGLSGIETAGLIYTYRAGRFSTGMGTCHDNNNDDIDILNFTFLFVLTEL